MINSDENFLVKLEGVNKTFNISPHREGSFLSAVFSRKLAESQAVYALQNINFTLHSGEVVGVIGANGAGKSTLLKVISGILKPDSGKMITNSHTTPLLSLDAGFHDELSGEENLFLYGYAIGWSKDKIDEIVEKIFEFSGIKIEHRKLLFKYYSTGMRTRLIFSATTIFEPELLLIDEVLTVGDIDFQEKSFKRIEKLLEKSKAVMIISHALTQLKRICNKLLLMDNGKIIKYGNFDEVMDFLKEISRNNNELRISYDIFRTREELRNDSLTQILESNKSKVPKSSLPPFKFDFNYILDENFSLNSEILPFTTHNLNITPDSINYRTNILNPPKELKNILEKNIDLSKFNITNIPTICSYSGETTTLFNPVRSFINYPQPDEFLTQNPGKPRSTIHNDNLEFNYKFNSNPFNNPSFSTYKFFTRDIDISDLNTVEFQLLNSDSDLELVFILGDRYGNYAYSQAKSIVMGNYEKKIIFYLKNGFVSTCNIEQLLKNIRYYKLLFFPQKSLSGKLEISIPQFYIYDERGAFINKIELNEKIKFSKLNTLSINLKLDSSSKEAIDEKFKIARGHLISKEYQLATEELTNLLGNIENSEIHAFISKSLENEKKFEKSAIFALHSLFLSISGRGEFFKDRLIFLKNYLSSQNNNYALYKLERIMRFF